MINNRKVLAGIFAQKYVFIDKISYRNHEDDYEKDGFRVLLRVGVQSFYINSDPLDTIEEARWLQQMLGEALLQIVLNEQ